MKDMVAIGWLKVVPPAVVMAAAAILVSSCTTRTILNGRDAIDSLTAAPKPETVRVWLVKSEGDAVRLVPVDRPVSRLHNDRLKEAVTELLGGPSAEEAKAGLNTEIPRGTILLDIHRQGANLELNLSRRFQSGGGADSLETRLDQLSRTVADAAGADKVYLSVEGERLSTAAGEGLEVKQPLN